MGQTCHVKLFGQEDFHTLPNFKMPSGRVQAVQGIWKSWTSFKLVSSKRHPMGHTKNLQALKVFLTEQLSNISNALWTLPGSPRDWARGEACKLSQLLNPSNAQWATPRIYKFQMFLTSEHLLNLLEPLNAQRTSPSNQGNSSLAKASTPYNFLIPRIAQWARPSIQKLLLGQTSFQNL